MQPPPEVPNRTLTAPPPAPATTPRAPAAREARLRLVLLLAAIFAAAVPLIAHARFLSGDRIIYYADTAQLQLPRYAILTQALQEHRTLPLWQDLLYGGMPFHASPENPTLYPPVLALAAFLPPLWTINLTILLHLAAAGLGMYLLVLRLWGRLCAQRGEPDGARGGPAAAGAVLAATLFALSHTTRIDFVHLVTYGAAHALLPWILLAADALLHGERPRRAAGLLALALAGLVLTGGLYVVAYAVPLLAVWFACLGLLGGARARRRTLTWGLAAAGVAGLIVLAKFLPYREWVETTARGVRLPYDEALGVTLGGHGSLRPFTWAEAWIKIKRTTGGGWGLLPVLLALPLLRHGVVRVVVGLGLFFFGVALGGPAEPLHRLVYELVPPIDQTRSAIRAWTVTNAMLPIAAGLGSAWLLSRFALLRRHAWAAALLGIAAATAIAPRLDDSGVPHEQVIENPASLRELRGRYVHWPEAAARAGKDWRAVWFDKRKPDGHNEQLISSLLGVESPAGYLGHAWPWRLERHLYGAPGAPLDDDVRARRLGLLSVRWLVTTDPAVPPPPERPEIVPAGADGTRLVENPSARPRAFFPAAAIGIAGDADDSTLHALLDSPDHPMLELALVVLEEGRPVSDEELGALDLLVLCGNAPSHATLLARANASRVPVTLVGSAPAAELREVLGRAGELSRERDGEVLAFQRLRPGRTHIGMTPPERPRFAVVSEPWSLYPGWELRSDAGVPLGVRRADGILSAVLVPAGTGAFQARYRPRSVFVGLAWGAVGTLLALILVARRR